MKWNRREWLAGTGAVASVALIKLAHVMTTPVAKTGLYIERPTDHRLSRARQSGYAQSETSSIASYHGNPCHSPSPVVARRAHQAFHLAFARSLLRYVVAECAGPEVLAAQVLSLPLRISAIDRLWPP